MKKLSVVLLIVAIAGTISCGGKKVRFETAKEYNDYIVKVVQDVDQAWSNVIHEKNLEKSLSKAEELTQISQDGINKLENLIGFKKEKLYRRSGIEYVKHINKISKKELKEFLRLIHVDSPDQTRINELLMALDEDRESKFHVLTVCQELFAVKYSLKLKQVKI